MPDVILKPIETDAEYEAAWRLILDTFWDNPTEQQIADRISRSRREPGFDFAKHQIVLVDGELVCRACLGEAYYHIEDQPVETPEVLG